MRKIVIATAAALLISAAATATPAEARCFWNGYAWHCYRPHRSWWYHRHHHHHGHHYRRWHHRHWH